MAYIVFVPEWGNCIHDANSAKATEVTKNAIRYLYEHCIEVLIVSKTSRQYDRLRKQINDSNLWYENRCTGYCVVIVVTPQGEDLVPVWALCGPEDSDWETVIQFKEGVEGDEPSERFLL